MPLSYRLARHTLVCFGFSASIGLALASQTVPPSPQPSTQAAGAPTQQAAPLTSAQRRAQLRAQRRAARRLAAQQSANPPQSPQLPSDSVQRSRDQKLLDAQKAQSAETARENDAVTGKAVREQQQVQAEPRIQDAPGPGSQPLPGDPIVPPAQPADPPRIQDAPGPAQTLPKAPPPAPAPQS